MKRILSSAIVFLLIFVQASQLAAQTNENILAGAYIMDMGVVPQTKDNALKPYGLVYALTNEQHIPVKWSINPSKAADGIDFSYDTLDFKGGPFIVTEDHRNDGVDSTITAWESLGVVGYTTTSDITVPIQTTINFVIEWTLDLQNGSIAEDYLIDAGIPTTAYTWTLPKDIQCCQDVFVMPHADPTWEDHGNLLNWNDSYANGGCEGAIWAACHAVSALENLFDPADTTVQMNFLSDKISGSSWTPDYADNSLILWGDHGDGSLPYSYNSPGTPPMQFMGDLDDAVTNGSEQIYIPHNQWSSHTTISAWDPDHSEVSGSQVAAILAFGQAFGDSTRGKIMYQAGHDHGGSSPDNIAAQRAMLNFSFWAASDKSIQVNSEVDIDSVIIQGVPATASVTASGGTGTFTYQWSSTCDATFSNPDSSSTDFIATFYGTCVIQCIITDGCGRMSYTKSFLTIDPNPCQPVEGRDYMGGTVFTDSDMDAVFDTTESGIGYTADVQVYHDADGNGTLNGSEGDSIIATATTSAGVFSFEFFPPHSAYEPYRDSVDLGIDDAMESNTGSMSLTGSKLEFRETKPYNGMRFTGVGIPRRSYIQSAYLEFEASTTNTAITDLEISVHSSHNSGIFRTTPYNISSRYDTTIAVSWTNVDKWTKNERYFSPDISPLIQSITDRLNWNSGQSIVVIVRWVSGDMRKAKTYEAGEDMAPRLHVVFSPEDYPVSYILKVDESTTPFGGVITAPMNETAVSFTGPYQAFCSVDIGSLVNRTIAVEDENFTIAGFPVSGDVMINDYDPQDDNLIFSSFLNQDGSGTPIVSPAVLAGVDTAGSPVANAGTIIFNANGYTFSPQGSFAGEVIVDYAMLDDGLPVAYDTTDLTIMVSIASNPNIPGDNSMMALDDYNLSYGEPVTGNYLINDIDPELDNVIPQSYVYDSDGNGIPDSFTTTFSQALAIGGTDPDGNAVANAGTIQFHANGNYDFTPQAGFEGKICIDYSDCDDVVGIYNCCSSARLTIEVLRDYDLLSNDPPLAGDDYAATYVNLPVTSQWLVNDNDVNGDSITVNGVAINIDPDNPGPGTEIGTYVTAQGGSLTMYDDGNYTYTPFADYFGPDQLCYYICDVVASPLCDSATIFLFVSPMYYDYGDLPAEYPAVGHLIAHIDANYIPDKPQSFWLGSVVDSETDAKVSMEADGDNTTETDDEEGLIIPFYSFYSEHSRSATFKVIVNGTEAGMKVYYGLWIDWEYDGDFEAFYSGFGTISNDPGERAAIQDTVEFLVSFPDSVSADMMGLRLRAFSSLPDSSDFEGNTRNGEVEDYFMRNDALLPVELTTFEAVARENDVDLDWQTASEINNDYFSVQRSTDFIYWDDIGAVFGHGTCTDVHDYEYLDQDLDAGVYYYRLKQIDYDGSYEFSETRSVQIIGGTNSRSEIAIYPIPASTRGTIKFDGLGNNVTMIRLISIDGKQSYRIPVDGNTINLSGTNLDAGMYVLDISDSDNLLLNQIIVLQD